MGSLFDDERDYKRTLGIRDRQILYRTADKKCQNPACGKEIDFDEMQVGHKNAWAKGNRTTMKNSVCLCYRCNKLQGTDSWTTFLKKQGVKDENSEIKEILNNLTISQLKFLAKKHNVKIKGKIESGFIGDYHIAPSKNKYINQLAKTITKDNIDSELKEIPKPEKKKKIKRNSSLFDW